jgi:hypothetical protein
MKRNRVLTELSGRLARLAHQFHWLGIERVSAELMAISRELSAAVVPDSTSSIDPDEPKG